MKNSNIHDDARAEINKVTAIRLAQRSTLKRLVMTGFAAAATTLGVVGCNTQEEKVPTIRDPENMNRTELGVLSGIFATLSAVGASVAGVFSFMAGEQLVDAKNGNNRYYNGYNLACQKVMSKKERVDIISRIQKISFDDAAVLLNDFESQESARQAIAKAQKEAAEANKPVYSVRKGYDHPSEVSATPAPEPHKD